MADEVPPGIWDRLFDFAEAQGIGFWQLICAIAVILLVLRAPALVKEVGTWANERLRINKEAEQKQAQLQKRIDDAARRRETLRGKTMTGFVDFSISTFWVVAPLALLIVAFVVPWRMRRAVLRLRAYSKHSSVFFQKAEALVSDDETPVEIVDMMRFLNDRVTRRDGGPFVLGLLLRPMDPSAGTEVSTEFRSKIEPFFARRPELEKAYRVAILSWVLAILSNSRGFVGFVVRQVTKHSLWMLDEERVAKKVSADEMKRHRDRGTNDRGGHHNGNHAFAG